MEARTMKLSYIQHIFHPSKKEAEINREKISSTLMGFLERIKDSAVEQYLKRYSLEK